MFPRLHARRRLICDAQWSHFRQHGYVNLGKVVPQGLLDHMCARIDAIMLGDVSYPRLMMQRDKDNMPRSQMKSSQACSSGFKGRSLRYRKVGEAGFGLEMDDVFLRAMTLPVFQEACAEMYGGHCDISIARAMLFNKPTGQKSEGTATSWHQDGGDFWGLDRDPIFFAWTALDDATRENGCMRVVPGSHRAGLVSQRGHTLSDACAERLNVEACSEFLEVAAGDTVLCHNWLLHCSGINPSERRRRAFSACYVDARTRLLHPKPRVWPEGTPGPQLGLSPGGDFPLIIKLAREVW